MNQSAEPQRLSLAQDERSSNKESPLVQLNWGAFRLCRITEYPATWLGLLEPAFAQLLWLQVDRNRQ